MQESEEDQIASQIDTWLVAGYGSKQGETTVYGLKDLFDILKNLVVAASLISASWYFILSCSETSLSPGAAATLRWISIASIVPLAVLCSLLLRQFARVLMLAVGNSASGNMELRHVVARSVAIVVVLGVGCSIAATAIQAVNKIEETCPVTGTQ